ncbi:MAG: Fur family transcriptional regulator [Anaerolineae bacterium]
MQRWTECLSEAGYRVTEPRQAVMEVLQKTERPLKPQEILERGAALRANLGLVTVYRTLDLFEQLGLVRRVHRGEGCQGYLPASPGHRHVLICQSCGRAVEFVGYDDLDDLIARVERRTAFQVVDHLLQLFGRCPACQEQAGEDL